MQLAELLEEAEEIQRLPLPPDERHDPPPPAGRIRNTHYRWIQTGVRGCCCLNPKP